MKTFKPISPKVDFAKLEDEILNFWKEDKTFEKSVEQRPEDKRWTFLDGPPFVTGMPHYGSLLSSLPKDLFGRYYTMKGYRVRRVWGWDGHGLPIENKVENELGITSKRDIEEVVGIKKFIDECMHYVNVVSSDWEWYIDKIGRWVDFKHAYKTWARDYMESVMWVFKQLYDKDLVYKGLRVSLYCPHCATPISNFEVAMDADNYKEITDPATTYKYPMVGEKDTYILAWSTTPWNKIVTPALAVNPKLAYVKVKQNGEYYILAKTTLGMLKKSSHPELAARGEPRFQRVSGSPTRKNGIPDQVRNDSMVDYEIVAEFTGKDLIGKKYVPHYDYYPVEPGEKVFEIIGGDFVTADEGTGVVTIAAYGEEDLAAMKKENVHIETHLDEEGTVKQNVPKFGGMYYLKANKAVDEDLKERGLVYETRDYSHNVPLCWRCHTRLYYAPIDAWYVNVQTLKPLMKRTNEEVNWVPSHFKYGRFLKSLENAPDWNISRNRYWGSPVPVWECECGERFVPGSIKELEEASGQKVTDLHRPEIDVITVPCPKCGQTMRRTPEVLDSWIEAGSASFAERHFPFNQSEKLSDFFPPDFIAEYTGQIRAWFYVLHVIGAALYQSRAFKNVMVEGVILGTDGRKMSKNYKNYPDPREMLDKYGGDALRMYLLGSPVMHGEDILISEEQYRNQVRGTMLILWNVYNFFLSNAIIDKWQSPRHPELVSGSPKNKYEMPNQVRHDNNILDQWIESLLNRLVKDVTEALDAYDTVGAIEKIKQFIDDLSTWYIRRSRDRVGPTGNDEADKQDFYQTTYNVLVTLSKLMAPITPFLSEAIYKNLTGEDSVHLTDWPTYDQALIDPELEAKMAHVRKIVEVGHSKRKESNIKVRQPLVKVTVYPANDSVKFDQSFDQLVQDELNVKNVAFTKGDGELEVEFDTHLTGELIAEGQARELIRKIQEERKRLQTTQTAQIDVSLEDWPASFEQEIKRKTLIRNLDKGAFAVKPVA